MNMAGLEGELRTPFSLLCQDDLLGRCSTHPPGKMSIFVLVLQAVGATQEDT